jgi:hypothetical protein
VPIRNRAGTIRMGFNMESLLATIGEIPATLYARQQRMAQEKRG